MATIPMKDGAVDFAALEDIQDRSREDRTKERAVCVALLREYAERCSCNEVRNAADWLAEGAPEFGLREPYSDALRDKINEYACTIYSPSCPI